MKSNTCTSVDPATERHSYALSSQSFHQTLITVYLANMILPGYSLVSRKIISGVASRSLQVQPCGVDLTLQRVLTWTSAGAVDFDNNLRQAASTREITLLPTAPSEVQQAASENGGEKHRPRMRLLSRRVQRNCLCSSRRHGPDLCPRLVVSIRRSFECWGHG